MNTAGLSLSDAPPFNQIYPFFIVAAFFGLLSFAALAVFGESFRYAPAVIASVHLFTIGFLLNAAFGSLVQMLPVVGGVKIDNPKIVRAALFCFCAGALLFFVGFVYLKSFLYLAAAILLIGAFISFGMLLYAILKTKNPSQTTIKGIRSALFAIFFGVAVGTHLLISHAMQNIGESHLGMTQIHIGVCVLGFFGALIVSVSHQVLPMFYVTPEFPKFCKVWPQVIVVSSLLLLIPNETVNIVAKVALWVAFAAFTVVALKKLRERRRLLSNASLKLWQTGLGSLLIALPVWAYNEISPFEGGDFLIALLFGVGFLGSIVKAMMNKIVPFLAWFHLTTLGRWDAPSVREMITDRAANRELYLHLASIVLFLSSTLFSQLFIAASIVAALSFAQLLFNIVRAVKIYNAELTKPL